MQHKGHTVIQLCAQSLLQFSGQLRLKKLETGLVHAVLCPFFAIEFY